MASYKAPLREINFVLQDVLKVGRLAELDAYQEATPDTSTGFRRSNRPLEPAPRSTPSKPPYNPRR